MDLKIDTSVLQSVMHEALLRQLKDVDREALIAAALAHLMEPDKSSGWGAHTKTPLHRAFEYAADQCARALLIEEFKKPEQQARLAQLCSKAMDKILSDPHGKVVQNMANAFTASLVPRD